MPEPGQVSSRPRIYRAATSRLPVSGFRRSELAGITVAEVEQVATGQAA